MTPRALVRAALADLDTILTIDTARWQQEMGFRETHLEQFEGLPEEIQWVLADAQTNGGLLAAVPPSDVPKALRALEKAGVDAALIGEVVAGRPGIDVLG